MRDIVENLDMPIARQARLLLGRGWRGRAAILLPLLEEKPASLTVVMHGGKSQALASSLPVWRGTAVGSDLMGERFDIIIDGTSAACTTNCRRFRACSLDALACDSGVQRRPGTPSSSEREKPACWPMAWACWSNKLRNRFTIWRGVRPKPRRVMAILRSAESTWRRLGTRCPGLLALHAAYQLWLLGWIVYRWNSPAMTSFARRDSRRA